MGEDALIIHHDVNLGIAVDLDNQGLIVPVVHNAEELNFRGWPDASEMWPTVRAPSG